MMRDLISVFSLVAVIVLISGCVGINTSSTFKDIPTQKIVVVEEGEEWIYEVLFEVGELDQEKESTGLLAKVSQHKVCTNVSTQMVDRTKLIVRDFEPKGSSMALGYLAGAGALAGGTVMYFTEPDPSKTQEVSNQDSGYALWALGSAILGWAVTEDFRARDSEVSIGEVEGKVSRGDGVRCKEGPALGASIIVGGPSGTLFEGKSNKDGHLQMEVGLSGVLPGEYQVKINGKPPQSIEGLEVLSERASVLAEAKRVAAEETEAAKWEQEARDLVALGKYDDAVVPARTSYILLQSDTRKALLVQVYTKVAKQSLKMKKYAEASRVAQLCLNLEYTQGCEKVRLDSSEAQAKLQETLARKHLKKKMFKEAHTAASQCISMNPQHKGCAVLLKKISGEIERRRPPVEVVEAYMNIGSDYGGLLLKLTVAYRYNKPFNSSSSMTIESRCSINRAIVLDQLHVYSSDFRGARAGDIIRYDYELYMLPRIQLPPQECNLTFSLDKFMGSNVVLSEKTFTWGR